MFSLINNLGCLVNAAALSVRGIAVGNDGQQRCAIVSASEVVCRREWLQQKKVVGRVPRMGSGRQSDDRSESNYPQ